MSREKRMTLVQAVFLSFLLSWAAVGALATGLKLNVESIPALMLPCFAAAMAGSLLGILPGGGWALPGAVLLTGLYLWRSEEALGQILEMLRKMSGYYHNAYGWPIWAPERTGTGETDLALSVLGIWIGLVNGCSISRGKGGMLGFLLASLPLMACVVVTDTVPDSMYLYLWLLSLVLVLLSRRLRREKQLWGNNMVLLAAVPTALVLALLFWAVPREGYDKHPAQLQEKIVDWVESIPEKWNETVDEIAQKVDGAYQPDAVNLQNIGPRPKRVYPVMDVSAPFNGTVYLRGQHYDIHPGTGWQVSDSQEPFKAPVLAETAGRITITTRSVRDVLYLPYYPEESLNLFDGRIENNQGIKHDSYEMRRMPSSWNYVLQSVSDTFRQPFFARDKAANSEEKNLYLPEDTYLWAVETVDSILTDEENATAVAKTIADFVRSSASYDLNTSRMDREYDDFARWFLEDSDTGYCVHFATATVVLLRAAGVEARYVEGYMFTGRNGETVTVTADQAHAWAEYYEPILDAWIPIEATPADLSSEETEPVEVPETEPIIQTLPQHGETTAPTEEDPVPEGTRPGQTGGNTPGKHQKQLKIPFWLWLVLLPVPLAEGQRLLRRKLRSRRICRDSRAKALALWARLEDFHKLLGTAAPEECRTIARRAKYSPHRITGEELSALEQALEDAKRQISGKNWRVKLLARYVYGLI